MCCTESNYPVTLQVMLSLYIYIDKFFSSGYYRGNRQLGRDLNITYHSVTYTPVNGSLTLNREFSTKDDIYWLNCKYTYIVCA